MSCWRVLELSKPLEGERIPQLLVKPVFHTDSYIVHLTDLSNIWCEELDLDGIVTRASQEQSPIEVSKQDPAQLALLLENVRKPLGSFDEATCHITRKDGDGVTLHAVITLPEPLDSLSWKFHLEKRTSITLKNELILPLLVSSHIQHERINGLVSIIADKDKAITRLVDQYESSNLDLAAVFPSVGSLKAGRRAIKREQAARHIPALQPFREETWREATEQLKDSHVTTLGLFQEALAQSTPKVPLQLKSEDRENAWWNALPTRISQSKATVKTKAMKPAPAVKPKKVDESSDAETEDEFETHENFKTRNLPDKPARIAEPTPHLAQNGHDTSEAESTDDDEDLDAPPKSQSHSQSRIIRRSPPRTKSVTPEPPPTPKASTPPSMNSRSKGFRIGGKAKAAEAKIPSSPHEDAEPTPDAEALPTRESMPPSSQVGSQANMTPRKTRKPFRIGGKGKHTDHDEEQRAITPSPKANRTRATQSPTAGPPSSPLLVQAAKEMTPVAEVHEETPEEKAERKRAELKRKNEEAARKQAQQKKKKRF